MRRGGAAYGKQLLTYLSERLTADFGSGFTERNLRNMRQFYQAFPIRHALRSELSWTHYRLLMGVENEQRRTWYMNEAADVGWSSRQLEATVRYSVLADKQNLFASQYMTYLPTEEELARAPCRERDEAEGTSLWRVLDDEAGSEGSALQ